MIHLWRLLTILYFVGFFVIIVRDMLHPERWDTDWMRDPRIYLPMFAVVAILGLLLALRWYWTERRKR